MKHVYGIAFSPKREYDSTYADYSVYVELYDSDRTEVLYRFQTVKFNNDSYITNSDDTLRESIAHRINTANSPEQIVAKVIDNVLVVMLCLDKWPDGAHIRVRLDQNLERIDSDRCPKKTFDFPIRRLRSPNTVHLEAAVGAQLMDDMIRDHNIPLIGLAYPRPIVETDSEHEAPVEEV